MTRRNHLRFGVQGEVLFVTTAVRHHYRIFSLGPQYFRILLASLSYVRAKYGGRILAYVLMPTHIHLVVRLPEGISISAFMRDFKKFTSTRIRQQIEHDGHQHWLNALRRNALGVPHQVFKLWADRFDAVSVRSERSMERIIAYMHHNPVRARLVIRAEDWPYSSCRTYMTGVQTELAVETDWFRS